MNEFDELTSRLRSLGHQPVDPTLEAKHSTWLASVPLVDAGPSRLRPAMATALVAGALLGGGGLAGAVTGTLPKPAQDVAHQALAKVGIDVPKGSQPGEGEDGKEKASKAKARVTAGCVLPDGTQFSGNHGQWVKAHPDDPATPVNERQEAAKSDCGKPLQAVEHRQAGSTGGGQTGTPPPPPAAGPPGASGAPGGAPPGQQGKARPQPQDEGDEEQDDDEDRKKKPKGTHRGTSRTPAEEPPDD